MGPELPRARVARYSSGGPSGQMAPPSWVCTCPLPPLLRWAEPRSLVEGMGQTGSLVVAGAGPCQAG